MVICVWWDWGIIPGLPSILPALRWWKRKQILLGLRVRLCECARFCLNANVIGGKGESVWLCLIFLKRKRKVIGGKGEIVLLCQVLRFRRTRGEPRHFYKGDHPQRWKNVLLFVLIFYLYYFSHSISRTDTQCWIRLGWIVGTSVKFCKFKSLYTLFEPHMHLGPAAKGDDDPSSIKIRQTLPTK